VQNYSVVALAVASDHKTLSSSNKNEPPAAAKLITSPRESGLPVLTPGVWHLLWLRYPPGSLPTGRANCVLRSKISLWRNARNWAAQPLKLQVKEAPETDRFLERLFRARAASGS